MKWKIALVALALASLACNLARVLDPSLPTWTPAPQTAPTDTPEEIDNPVEPVSSPGRVAAGDLAFFYGDWNGALAAYQDAIDSEDNETRSAALLGVGRTYHAMGNLLDARRVLQTHLDLFPDSDLRPEATYALAEVYRDLEDYPNAASAFQSYLDQRPGLIDALVQEQLGDALLAAGDTAGAIAAYQTAAAAPRITGPESLQVKIGDAYFQSGDYQSAILTYQNVYAASGNDYTKAQMDLNMGRAYAALEQPDQAYPLYLDAVENYPLSYASYAALIELVNAEVPVSELDRGLVDYFAANTIYNSGDHEGALEVYNVAIAAFDRYLLQNPEEGADTATYYRALAQRASGEYEKAIQDFNTVIEDYAFTDNWVEAYSQKAYTQWYFLDDYDGAIQTLLDFVAATPSQPRAAEFLFDAGRIAEHGGQLQRSAELWERTGNEYPSSQYAYDAFFLAAIDTYRMENAGETLRLLERALEGATSLEQQSQALYWTGKLQHEAGDEQAAQDSWTQAAATDSTGYYSERARDVLDGVAPFNTPNGYSFSYDAEAERAEAEDWLRTVFGLPADTDLSGPGALADDPRYQRGMEMWRLGKYEAARTQFEDLRLAVQDNAADTYRLANALIEIGLYRPAIFAARQVMTLAGMSDADTLQAPAYFNRLRFGPYYLSLVEDEGQANGLDPMFLLSTMRQESLFEGFVNSTAGARGLMQIVPATGAEIATLQGWPPNYSANDLYRPLVSIRFGASYLARQRNNFGGDLYKALAAYNAGPGNAAVWDQIAGDDEDLFLEVIDYPETHDHIKGIYEIYSIYRSLYGN